MAGDAAVEPERGDVEAIAEDGFGLLDPLAIVVPEIPAVAIIPHPEQGNGHGALIG